MRAFPRRRVVFLAIFLCGCGSKSEPVQDVPDRPRSARSDSPRPEVKAFSVAVTTPLPEESLSECRYIPDSARAFMTYRLRELRASKFLSLLSFSVDVEELMRTQTAKFGIDIDHVERVSYIGWVGKLSFPGSSDLASGGVAPAQYLLGGPTELDYAYAIRFVQPLDEEAIARELSNQHCEVVKAEVEVGNLHLVTMPTGGTFAVHSADSQLYVVAGVQGMRTLLSTTRIGKLFDRMNTLDRDAMMAAVVVPDVLQQKIKTGGVPVPLALTVGTPPDQIADVVRDLEFLGLSYSEKPGSRFELELQLANDRHFSLLNTATENAKRFLLAQLEQAPPGMKAEALPVLADIVSGAKTQTSTDSFRLQIDVSDDAIAKFKEMIGRRIQQESPSP